MERLLQNPSVAQHFTSICEMIIPAVEMSHGISLSPDDLLSLPDIRMAIALEEKPTGSWREELENLPPMIERQATAEAVAAIRRGDADALAALNQLPPAARIAKARALGLERPIDRQGDRREADAFKLRKLQHSNAERAARQNQDAATSEKERLEKLMSMPPNERLNLARKWGMA